MAQKPKCFFCNSDSFDPQQVGSLACTNHPYTIYYRFPLGSSVIKEPIIDFCLLLEPGTGADEMVHYKIWYYKKLWVTYYPLNSLTGQLLYNGNIPPGFSPETAEGFYHKIMGMKAFL